MIAASIEVRGADVSINKAIIGRSNNSSSPIRSQISKIKKCIARPTEVVKRAAKADDQLI